jgi:hypothetical protein
MPTCLPTFPTRRVKSARISKWRKTIKKQTRTSAYCQPTRRGDPAASSQVCLIAALIILFRHGSYALWFRALLPVAQKALRRGGASACAVEVDCMRKSRQSRCGHLVAARDWWVTVSSLLSVQVSPGGARLRAANSTAMATFLRRLS